MLSHYWKNIGSPPISLRGDLKTVFVGRWSIGNVQMIYLWYDRFIPNPNSFDVSRTNHCDIELDISMLLVHLDRPGFAVQTMLTPDDLNTMCFTGGDSPKQMESSINRCVREWRKTELYRFGVTWNNDVGSIPSTKMYLPVYIKYICLLSVTKWGRGRKDITIQSAIQLVVIKIIIYQNIIWMYGSKMYVLY